MDYKMITKNIFGEFLSVTLFMVRTMELPEN